MESEFTEEDGVKPTGGLRSNYLGGGKQEISGDEKIKEEISRLS